MSEVQFTLHPIKLTSVRYREFTFALKEGPLKPPFRFPSLRIHSSASVDEEENTGRLELTVSSADEIKTAGNPGKDIGDPHGSQPQKSADEIGTDNAIPVLRFSFVMEAEFSVLEDTFPDARRAIDEFMHSSSPVLIAWPYIRSYMADMTRYLGLPPFHLPMVQVPAPLPPQDDSQSDEG